MFTIADIITAGSDLVGWRESANVLYPDLPANLKVSQSGYYVNDLPGIDFDIITKGLSGDQISASDYLEIVQQSEIAGIVNEFIIKAQSKLGTHTILTNFDVCNGVADTTDLATKNARFVGWVITPRSSNNIKAEITKIGLQLNASQTLKIYLYETSQVDAIKTFDFVYNKPLSVQWLDVDDFIVKYRGSGTRQSYLLGYYEYDPNNVVTGQLTGSAVEFDFDCGCNNAPRRVFGEYVWIQPIEIANSFLNYTASDYILPDITDLTSFYCDESRGMFAKINVKCDITDLILDNLSVFAKALQYKIAIRVLDDFLASKRLNDTTDAKRFRDFAEEKRNMYWSILNGWIDNTGMKRRGLIEDIVIDFSRMDDVCLPCEQDGIKIVSMGRQ
jgi:hypothetical protein